MLEDIVTLLVVCFVFSIYAAIIETVFGKSPYEKRDPWK